MFALGNAKHRFVAPFVHIFANVINGFDGVAVLSVAVDLERFQQKQTIICNDPAVIDDDITVDLPLSYPSIPLIVSATNG